MMGTFWIIDISLAVIASILTGFMLFFYSSKALKLKSAFTLGLTAFSAAFFTQSLLSLVAYLKLAQAYSSPVAIPLMIIMLAELVGLSTLTYITRQ
ncbi:hypothetical protein PQ610_01580 [Tardisphaera miroshnichenkoae]